MSNVTIQDIADAAGVSKSTVSRVLNGTAAVNAAKHQAVMEATRRLGFRPNVLARSLASGKSMTIGVLTQLIGSPFYDTIAQGVIARLGGTGYSPIFVDGQLKRGVQLDGVQALIGRQVDGMLLIGGDVTEAEISELCGNLPVAVAARQLEGANLCCVWMDNVDGGYQATKHLIDNGHRSIAIIRGLPHHSDSTDRYLGYCRALDEAGIPIDHGLVLEGDFSGESAVERINELVASGREFTAVFAMNDTMAFGARLSLSRHGLSVPGDVSIIGFDDQMESAFMTPPLTSIRQPAREMGRSAADAVLTMINGEAVESTRVQAELVQRESVQSR